MDFYLIIFLKIVLLFFSSLLWISFKNVHYGVVDLPLGTTRTPDMFQKVKQLCIIHLLTSIALKSSWALHQHNYWTHERYLREMRWLYCVVSRGALCLKPHPLLFGKTSMQSYKIFFSSIFNTVSSWGSHNTLCQRPWFNMERIHSPSLSFGSLLGNQLW